MDLIIKTLQITGLKGPVKKILDVLLKRRSNFLWRYVWIPLFILAIPSIILFYFSSSYFKGILDSHLPFAASFINDNPIRNIVISGVLIYINSIIDPFFNYYATRFQPIKSSPFLTLIEMFRMLVESKERRFSNYLRTVTVNDRRDTFNTITQPGEQIFTLTCVLYDFYHQTYPDIDFKVRIVKVDNDLPTEWLTHQPLSESPKTCITQLQNESSTIMHCIRLKSIQIVEDIANCQNLFFRTRHDDTDEIGSVVCYPVIGYMDGVVNYVISVSASEPKFFEVRQSKYYKFIMNEFALRIKLEHSLARIKEITNGEN